jgi:ABC-type Fe2+-enterobactin transport system substrate-binding protein
MVAKESRFLVANEQRNSCTHCSSFAMLVYTKGAHSSVLWVHDSARAYLKRGLGFREQGRVDNFRDPLLTSTFAEANARRT